MFEIDGSTTQAIPIPSSRRRTCSLSSLLVRDQLQRRVQTGLVVAGVVEAAARCAIGEGLDEIPASQLGRVDSEPARGEIHRSLEREVELRAAEAAVQA